MALVPFSYASPFTDQLQLPERLFTIGDRLLKIRQAWKGDGKGGTDIGYGASVYPAAYVLAEYIERNPHLVRGKRVIELGTGTGFLGIAANILGATDVCLTDGDEQSLKLAQENVDANLLQPLPCRQGPRTPAPAGRDPQRQTLDASSTRHSDSDVVSEHVGTSHDAAGGGPGGRRKPSECSATISVRKLRWGREDDMRAACFPGGDGDTGSSSDDSGGCCPWDVVLGSDIAALPYASAYGDLLRTIVSLVNSGKSDGGEGDKVSLPSPREADGAQEEAINGDTRECEEETNRRGDKRRRVVVLLAHKRRHVSEEAFFEDLKEKLGGEKSVREMGEDDIHADFRGTGIRLHMFEVDV